MNRKAFDSFKAGGVEKRYALVLAEIIEYCKPSGASTGSKGASKSLAGSLSATALPSSATKLPLLSEKNFVDHISSALHQIALRIIKSNGGLSIGISVENMINTLLDSDLSHEHILALSSQIIKSSCENDEIEGRSFAEEAIRIITQQIQLQAQNCSAVYNASTRMKVRMKCAKILLDIAGLPGLRQPSWVALLIRDSLIGKEDLPHVCMEITINIIKDPVPFLARHINSTVPSSTVQNNWLLSVLPPPILLSCLESVSREIESLSGQTDIQTSGLWPQDWSRALRVALVLLIHLICKLSVERSGGRIAAGTADFFDCLVRALGELLRDLGEDLQAMVFQRTFALAAACLLVWQCTAADMQTGPSAGGSSNNPTVHAAAAEGRQMLRKVFSTVFTALYACRPANNQSLRLHQVFVGLLSEGGIGPRTLQDFRALCSEQNKIDIFAYLDMRREPAVAAALLGALTMIQETPSSGHADKSLITQFCEEMEVPVRLSSTGPASLWLRCLTLILEGQLLPGSVGGVSAEDHLLRLMTGTVLRRLPLMEGEGLSVHPWLQRCLEAWAGWVAATPLRRGGMFSEAALAASSQQLRAATVSDIWTIFSVPPSHPSASSDSSSSPSGAVWDGGEDCLAAMGSPVEHLADLAAAMRVEVADKERCEGLWQELLSVHAALSFSWAVVDSPQPIFFPSPLLSCVSFLPLRRAALFSLLLLSAAKKQQSLFKAERDGEQSLSVLSSHHLDKLLRSFLDLVLKLAPSILLSHASATSILRIPSKSFEGASEQTLMAVLSGQVVPRLLLPGSSEGGVFQQWLELHSVHPRPYLLELQTINMISQESSSQSHSRLLVPRYDLLLQEPFLLLLRLLPVVPLNTSVFDVVLFITRSLLLSSRQSLLSIAVDIKVRTYSTQKSGSADAANSMLSVASKINKPLFLDLQELIAIKLLVAFYHRLLPQGDRGSYRLQEGLLRHLRDRTHCFINSLCQDNGSLVLALMKVDYPTSRYSSRSGYYSYFSDHYFPFILGSSAVLQLFGKYLLSDIETMAAALLPLSSISKALPPEPGVPEAVVAQMQGNVYDRFESGNIASLNMGNIIQQLEIVLLQSLTYIKVVIAVTCRGSQINADYSFYTDNLPSPENLVSESVRTNVDKVAQALPGLLQRAYNCLTVFHHPGVNQHIDTFSNSIFRALLSTQQPLRQSAKDLPKLNFSIAINRFSDIATANVKGDSVGLKRLRKHLEEVMTAANNSTSADSTASDEEHPQKKKKSNS